MEKEGKIMSEEKKNLTDEERKELKENLKKQIDELSDEELNRVSGGKIATSKTCPKCGNPINWNEDICKECASYKVEDDDNSGEMKVLDPSNL